MKNIILFCKFVLLVSFITSCSSLNSNFDCPMKPGVNCASMDEVNAQIDRGRVGSSLFPAHFDQSKLQLKTVPVILPKSQLINQNLGTQPLRSPEIVKHIWVAPFEDTAGNYHQDSDIYVVTQPGHWFGNPPQELIKEKN